MNLVKEFNNQKNDNMRMQYMLSTAFNVTMDEMNHWEGEKNNHSLMLGVTWIKHVIDAGCVERIIDENNPVKFNFKFTKRGKDLAYEWLNLLGNKKKLLVHLKGTIQRNPDGSEMMVGKGLCSKESKNPFEYIWIEGRMEDEIERGNVIKTSRGYEDTELGKARAFAMEFKKGDGR